LGRGVSKRLSHGKLFTAVTLIVSEDLIRRAVVEHRQFCAALPNGPQFIAQALWPMKAFEPLTQELLMLNALKQLTKLFQREPSVAYNAGHGESIHGISAGDEYSAPVGHYYVFAAWR
jgi:hypothetical protein